MVLHHHQRQLAMAAVRCESGEAVFTIVDHPQVAVHHPSRGLLFKSSPAPPISGRRTIMSSDSSSQSSHDIPPIGSGNGRAAGGSDLSSPNLNPTMTEPISSICPRRVDPGSPDLAVIPSPFGITGRPALIQIRGEPTSDSGSVHHPDEQKFGSFPSIDSRSSSPVRQRDEMRHLQIASSCTMANDDSGESGFIFFNRRTTPLPSTPNDNLVLPVSGSSNASRQHLVPQISHDSSGEQQPLGSEDHQQLLT
ncbi:hypothetical protein ACLOJK_007833 [Asimina triloba]